MIKYDVAVQMIEIYNEQVRDLLVSDGSSRRYPIKNLLLQVMKISTQYSHSCAVIPHFLCPL